jgi:hypothetical protein
VNPFRQHFYKRYKYQFCVQSAQQAPLFFILLQTGSIILKKGTLSPIIFSQRPHHNNNITSTTIMPRAYSPSPSGPRAAATATGLSLRRWLQITFFGAGLLLTFVQQLPKVFQNDADTVLSLASTLAAGVGVDNGIGGRDLSLEEPRDNRVTPTAAAAAALAVTADDGDPKTTMSDVQPLEEKNRTIALVHIGKAGGMTLRSSTAVFCKQAFNHLKDEEEKAKKYNDCVQKKFSHLGNKLSLETNQYFHMWAYNESALAQYATSFVLPVRNPVDRVISTFKYSHPGKTAIVGGYWFGLVLICGISITAVFLRVHDHSFIFPSCSFHSLGNCDDSTRFTPSEGKPWGCNVRTSPGWNKTTSAVHTIYHRCFPLPAIEDFAQAGMSPWYPISHFIERNYSMEERWSCRWLARNMIRGTHRSLAAPHLSYNYEYYASKSVWKFAQKEVFAIRTEHEWEDLVTLDRLLGGSGNFTNEGKAMKHGSDKYHKSPISTRAYQKLCCLLEHEFAIYQDILDRAINLTPQQKEDTMASLKQKCGVETSWTEWRTTCQNKMEEDLGMLAYDAKKVKVTKPRGLNW